ncbi:MAG TPA: type II toxin-antitoxin system PemK/MazF family toxin [Solirubrobacterales bacterium]|nr:type II toxin-antitoxin system PemK/MazF family toxin [Solirubrobacterales bacterium]
MTESTEPLRGEIWLASLGAARRGEPGKNRPVMVLSDEELLIGDPGELVVVVPLSSSVAPSRLRPPIDPSSGIDNDSAAVCRAVRGIARSRLLRRLGEASADTLADVEAALATVLGLEQPAASSR